MTIWKRGKKTNVNGRYNSIETETLAVLIDNIFVMLGGRVCHQIFVIPMGTNYAPYLANFFLYSYETYFIHMFLKIKLARSFYFILCYIDYVLSVNNSMFLGYASLSDLSHLAWNKEYHRYLCFILLLTIKRCFEISLVNNVIKQEWGWCMW